MMIENKCIYKSEGIFPQIRIRTLLPSNRFLRYIEEIQ